MTTLCQSPTEEFVDRFYALQKKYQSFLNQRNNMSGYKYQKLRAAFHSLDTNLHYLFTYRDIPDTTITTTI
jgi:hypothetical protein